MADELDFGVNLIAGIDISAVNKTLEDLKKRASVLIKDVYPRTKSTAYDPKKMISSISKADINKPSQVAAAKEMSTVMRRINEMETISNRMLGVQEKITGKKIDDAQAQKLMASEVTKYNKAMLRYHQEDLNAAVKSSKEKSKLRQADLVDTKKTETARQNFLLQKEKKIYDAEQKYRNARVKAVAADAQKINDNIRSSFVSAFSLHIVQMYLNPFIRAVRQVITETLRIYSEFEEKYADYLAKSTEFTDRLGKKDILEIAIGQTYAINDVADAMERFSASGKDVSKSQQALIDVLQTATIANVDFNDASNGIIRTMEAFQLNMSESTMIVDAMTNAANASTAELSDMVQWFQYAASSSYQAGLSVQQLAQYLAILSSTGLPGTGAAFRQMLLQFTKEDIRQKFIDRFGFAEEDFLSMDLVIQKLRDYVQASDDQSKSVQEVVRLLGGKVTSQQALNNLLVAEPELWNRVTAAVKVSGSTAELYAQMTDNAAASIERISNNLIILKTQIGEVFGPGLKALDILITAFTKLFTALPGWFKSGIIGTGMLALGLITLLFGGFTTLAGAIYAITGATKMFSTQTEKTGISVKALWKAIVDMVEVMLYQTGVSSKVVGAMSAEFRETQKLIGANQKLIQLKIYGQELDAKYALQSARLYGKSADVIMGKTADVRGQIKQNNRVINGTINNTKKMTSTVTKEASKMSGAMIAEFAIMIGVMMAFTAAEKSMESGAFGLANAIYILISAIAALKVATMIAGPWGIAAGLATFGIGTAWGSSKVSRAQTEYELKARRAAASQVGPGQIIENQTNHYVTVGDVTLEDPDAIDAVEEFAYAAGV